MAYRRLSCCFAVLLLFCLFIVVRPVALHPEVSDKIRETFNPNIVKYLTKQSFKVLAAANHKERKTMMNQVLKMPSESLLPVHLFDVFNIKKYFQKVKSTVSSASMCLACKVGIALLDVYIEMGATEDEVGNIARHVCTTFNIETPRVCQGIANLFKKEVVTVLSKVALSPKEICGLAIGASCSLDINPLHNWTVPLTPFPKPPVQPIPPPQPNSPVLRVLHLSDTHLDALYKEGSLANCGEPLCCRESSGVPKKASDAAGYWGDYRNCDTPLRTLENLLDHINKTHKFDYVIWTGDIPPHNIWDTSRNESTYLIHETSKLMKKYLGAVPIFPALGNHESSPVDSFPIPEIKGNDSIAWLYDELVQAWSYLFPSSALDTIKKGAYYSVPVLPGFRIISINMNYCNNLNWWLFINSTDPTGELSWLVNQLQMAEIKGEKVHILGHIPPGNFDCLSIWSHNYYEIVKRYESTITAQFFGHTHNDEFEIFYDTDEYTPSSRAFSIAYLGPSITTFNGLNPGYRMYTVDGNYKNSTWVVLDHQSYYMNLTEANLTNKPVWRTSYSALEAYNMTSLLPSEWDKLTKEFETNDNLFQQFYRYFMKLSDYNNKPCDAKCKKTLLCRLRKGCSDKGFCWS